MFEEYTDELLNAMLTYSVFTVQDEEANERDRTQARVDMLDIQSEQRRRRISKRDATKPRFVQKIGWIMRNPRVILLGETPGEDSPLGGGSSINAHQLTLDI